MKKFLLCFLCISFLLVGACSSNKGSAVSNQYTGLSVEPGRTAVLSKANSIDLKWNIQGDRFDITHQDGNDEVLTSITGNSVQFSNLSAESAHTFIIRSDTGEEAVAYGYSGLAQIQPKIISARAYEGSAEITWQALLGVSGYDLYVSEKETGDYFIIGSLESSVSSALVKGLTNGVTYYFKVVATYGKNSEAPLASMKAAMGSVFSVKPGYTFGEMTVVTPSDLLDKHVRLFKGYLRGTYVRFLWDAVPHAVKYNIYGATAADGEYTLVDEARENFYNLNLPIEKRYFKIKTTFDDGSEGPDSQFIFIQFHSSIDWTIEGGIESVTVTIAGFDSYESVTLSCMGVGESEWLSTSVTKTPFTAGPLEEGDYDCKLITQQDGLSGESDVRRVKVYRAPDPNEKLSVYVWENNAELRWNPVDEDGVKYSVLLSTDGGKTLSVAVDNITMNSYIIRDLSCEINYTAFVNTYKPDGSTSLSSPIDFALDAYYCSSIPPTHPEEESNSMVKLNAEGAPIRHCYGTAVINDKIYMFGGNGDNYMWVYDITTDKWTKLESAGDFPEARYYPAMEAINGKIYIFGGKGGGSLISTSFLTDTWMFDPSNGLQGTWTKLSPSTVPSGRTAMRSVMYNNKMYIFGGGAADTWVFDPNQGSQGTWNLLKVGAKVSTYGANVALIGNSVYIYGGFLTTGATSTSDKLWKYNLDNDSVVELKPSNRTIGVAFSNVVAYNNMMYTFGGFQGSVYNKEILRYNPNNGSEGAWEKIVPKGDLPLYGYGYGSATNIGNRFYVILGYSNSATSKEMYRYNP